MVPHGCFDSRRAAVSGCFGAIASQALESVGQGGVGAPAFCRWSDTGLCRKDLVFRPDSTTKDGERA